MYLKTSNTRLSANNKLRIIFHLLVSLGTPESVYISRLPQDCKEVYSRGCTQSGVYLIDPGCFQPMWVYCDMRGPWTTIQRRMDGSVNFTRAWGDYVHGFGNPRGEYWLGLENIHCMTTKHQTCSFRVDMTDFTGVSKYAQYSFFMVGNSASNYTLEISGYSGTAGETLIAGHGRLQFSTYDRDNDKSTSKDCAHIHEAGWWFHSCFGASLNGVYRHKTVPSPFRGIIWYTFTSNNRSLKYVDMKIDCN